MPEPVTAKDSVDANGILSFRAVVSGGGEGVFASVSMMLSGWPAPREDTLERFE